MRWLLLLVAAACGAPERRAELPFTLTADHSIVVAATLNETDALRLVLHTANADVRLTEAAVARTASLHFAGAAQVGSWGGGGSSRVSKGNRIRIGEWRRDDVTVWEDKLSSRDSDGKFGLDFFDGKIVEVDFARRRLAVHERVPAKAARYQRVALQREHGELFVAASCAIGGKTFTTKLLVHSGYAGGVLLADAFVAEAGLAGAIAITERSALSDSFGNRIEVRKGRLPQLALGAVELADVPVAFFSGGSQQISVLGSAVLSRFNLIFDVAHDALYVERHS